MLVIEYALSPEDAEVHRIENPAEMVSKFQFDHGWKNASLVETEITEELMLEKHAFIDKRVKIVSMGGKEGTVHNVTERGKFVLLVIVLDDSNEIHKMYNPQDIKFI